ncbi:hypothetical protein BDA96_05G248100 [Sorghum bicolor]|uniref:PGG domain-containing protein n=2 Tax=Sorghum bicolor TaxID=4558 RepID=A0A1Z5RK47_SORBI|nr:ankyrin repeat-containing protein At5g02620 isoform X1 [Sorghum bicolor]XP_021317224.1 ankyrin repeat-containing protein At5g02620 isoform X1 [Sorghum bicolor]XP_021317225.1 ankyrin repeat-containing protein At5g02620 isoform X1 [Sorghum bicolor]XP_021317226.1 ankyrin repeat-containing protein At5g02620 isoform X1 [Sorghum bicolor]XP_021317227.1 ankyrin repeat-containing protein At5g02620 isoform X1 [Sorghum bicolor]KAG0531134.1 hypothetical protein BDA96_05G248100 [Sorghum bicolor]OQU8410|eukprot:XP_021317223.1 ankyrin repeat-containing protein At5g02620 isoform X1 [Sorghum bicolor]
MSSSNGAEDSPSETNALVEAMDAKLMMATGTGDVQQLKHLVHRQEQDSNMMVVVMAKQTASVEKPCPQQRNMDPHLLALASSGSSEELQTLLNGENSQATGHGTDGSLTTLRASSYGGDTEANESILAWMTAQGDTALHVVAACSQGNNLFTRFREAKHILVEQNNKKRHPTRAERHAMTTYGDGDNFLESTRIIYGKAKHLLFVQNNKGDTPLHCAARAGKSNMVACLIDLASSEGENRIKELLRKENKHKETALHEAVRVGNKDIVDLLMWKDSELANFPEDGGTSPMYLAILLKWDEIVKTLYDKSSHGKLSFSGPNGQNALHAAVLRHQAQDLAKLLKWNETHLCPQNKDLTTQRDETGSTPLHFAAAVKFLFRPSNICRQVLEANPDALYQPDHAGVFPIHVAASAGASWNVDMFVKRCPGSAGLCDAKGKTFLHVAVEKKEANVIRSVCRNLSLSWIMNMVDNDGNTALHLAVEAGSLQMFCPLLANPQVNLNLPNSRGETPLDIAQYKIPEDGFYHALNSEVQICHTLRIASAVNGVRRHGHLKDNKTVRVKHDESKEMEAVKDSTGSLCIGSVLIATVTFGVTFAVPGGYVADDRNNGGTPIHARRYAFDAFIASNTLAFVLSTMATLGVMHSGSSLLSLQRRKMHIFIAIYLVSNSITSLTAAFALGAYVVLAPVAQKSAIATCVLSSLVLLYMNMEFIWRRLLLLPPLRTRKGLIWAWSYSAYVIAASMLSGYWPLIFIFGWAAYTNQSIT